MTMQPTGQVAPVSRRVVAYVLDALIAAGLGVVGTVILVIVAFTTRPLERLVVVMPIAAGLFAVVMIAWFAVYTYMQSKEGSIGMRAQGLRLARAADGSPLGFARALLRNVVFGLTASVVVGYFSALFDGSGRYQGWHDKAAGALMLDARVVAGQQPPPAAPSAAAQPSTPVPAPPGSFAIPAAPAAPLAAPMSPTVMPRPYLPPTVPGAPEHTVPAQPVFASPPQPVPASAGQPASPPVVPDGQKALIASVPGVTRDEGPRPPAAPRLPSAPVPTPPAPPAAPAPPVGPHAAGPVSGQAEDDADIESTRISIPGHRLVFTWDDGTRVSVSRRTVFGRNPAAEEGAIVVPVRDETRSLSKTHFEAAAEAAGGWVVDRHSTNGTTIVRDGTRIACPPGERVPIRLGDAIEIGDRIVTIGGYA